MQAFPLRCRHFQKMGGGVHIIYAPPMQKSFSHKDCQKKSPNSRNPLLRGARLLGFSKVLDISRAPQSGLVKGWNAPFSKTATTSWGCGAYGFRSFPKTRGPQYRSQYTITHLIRTPKKVPLILGNPLLLVFSGAQDPKQIIKLPFYGYRINNEGSIILVL